MYFNTQTLVEKELVTFWTESVETRVRTTVMRERHGYTRDRTSPLERQLSGLNEVGRSLSSTTSTVELLLTTLSM